MSDVQLNIFLYYSHLLPLVPPSYTTSLSGQTGSENLTMMTNKRVLVQTKHTLGIWH